MRADEAWVAFYFRCTWDCIKLQPFDFSLPVHQCRVQAKIKGKKY